MAIKNPLARTIKEVAGKLYESVTESDAMGNAAQAAFYFVFALFPLLLFLISVSGFVLGEREDLQSELYNLLGQIMPASALDLVESTIKEVTSNASGGKVLLGIILTLWSASAGIDNMRGTLNQVYGLKETRSWSRAKLTSVLLTVAIGILVLGLAFIFAYGRQIESDGVSFYKVFEWIAALLVPVFSLSLIYNFAPNHDPFKWKWITPGALLALFVWLIASGGFRLYIRWGSSYSATYGSLGAMIVLLMWLYITALAILLGGALNAVLDKRKKAR